MLELFLAFALSVSFARAVRLRHRGAIAGSSAALYLLSADVMSAIAAGKHGGPYGFFNAFFVGPGASPLRAAAALPLPGVLLEHPLWTRALRTACCWVSGWLCLRESARLNPLLPRAYALDHAALALVGAGIIDAVAEVVLLWAWVMLGEDALLVPQD